MTPEIRLTRAPDADPAFVQSALEGTGLLMHFYPRLFYQNDLEIYRPDLPAMIPVIGEIVRANVDGGKEAGRITSLGVAFRFDPADYDPTTLDLSMGARETGP